jgi:hypothetical protein
VSKWLLYLYRPARVSDGAGGFTETLGDATELYGWLEIQANRTLLIYERAADVRVGDLVETVTREDHEAARYRVTGIVGPAGAMHTRATVERVARPIVPPTIE